MVIVIFCDGTIDYSVFPRLPLCDRVESALCKVLNAAVFAYIDLLLRTNFLTLTLVKYKYVGSLLLRTNFLTLTLVKYKYVGSLLLRTNFLTLTLVKLST